MMNRLPVLVFGVSCILTVGKGAEAQQRADTRPARSSIDSADPRALAETLFFAAKGLMDSGRVSDACVKLAESYRLDPAAGSLLNLAVCHEKEGKTATAWGEFRQSLADARKANRADREQLAAEHIQALEPDLAFVTIEVPAEVRVNGIAVTLNGVPLTSAAWATELPVDPGDVSAIASAPEYRSNTQTVAIAKREHKSIRIPALDLAPRQHPPVSYLTPRRKAGIALGAAGLISVGIGTFFGVSALKNRSNSDSDCPIYSGERRCSTSGADAMSTAKSQAWISDIAIGAGAVSLLAGTWLLVTGSSKDEGPTEGAVTTAWQYRWGVGSRGASASVIRAF